MQCAPAVLWLAAPPLLQILSPPPDALCSPLCAAWLSAFAVAALAAALGGGGAALSPPRAGVFAAHHAGAALALLFPLAARVAAVTRREVRARPAAEEVAGPKAGS